MDRDSLPAGSTPTGSPATQSVGKAASSHSARQSFTDLARRCELLGVAHRFASGIEEAVKAIEAANKSAHWKDTRKKKLRERIRTVISEAEAAQPQSTVPPWWTRTLDHRYRQRTLYCMPCHVESLPQPSTRHRARRCSASVSTSPSRVSAMGNSTWPPLASATRTTSSLLCSAMLTGTSERLTLCIALSG